MSRRMHRRGRHLEYNLYLDAARTQVWGDGSRGTLRYQTRPVAGRIESVPIYGRFPAAPGRRSRRLYRSDRADDALLSQPMIRARSPGARAAAQSRALAFLLLLACGQARAQAADSEAPACEGAACDCEQDDGCWDFIFLSSGNNTSFGVSAVLSAVSVAREDHVDFGVLASYRADVYRARGLLNNHVLARGAIGAGSAGNQGELAGSVDFGVRLPVTTVSGPVLRLGPSGWLLGHDALQLALLEPMRLSAGYQQLVGDTLLEGGVTTSLLGMGRFAAADRSASLTGSLALGHYLAAHFAAFRFDGRVIYVRQSPFGTSLHLGIVAFEACALPRPVALCADLRYLQAALPPIGEVANRAALRATARGLYTGLTVALTP